MTVVINGDSGVTTPTSVFTDSSGNVGVGTVSPSYRVDVSAVNAEARLNGSNASRMLFTGGAYTWAVSSNYYVGASFVIANTAGGSGLNDFVIDASGDTKFNSGYGSAATAYGCRAWVNFKGTGTVAIRGSGNVSSVSDNTTADWTVNFTTAMPDANYAFPFGGEGNTAASNNGYPTAWPAASGGYLPTASALRIRGVNGANGAVDLEAITVAIFR